jgi:hypothetical protein
LLRYQDANVRFHQVPKSAPGRYSPLIVRFERSLGSEGQLASAVRRAPSRRSVYIPASHTEGRRMDSILGLSGKLMGLWLAIVGIAIVFGVLYAIGSSLGHRTRHRNHEDQGGRAG